MKGIIRIVSLCLILFCLLLPFGAFAASAQDISISVQWTDDFGTLQWSEPAVPVTDSPEETRFWLVLSPGTPLSGLTLNISDLSGSIAYFVPGQDALLEYVTDAMGSLDQPFVSISGYNAAGEEVAVYSLYISYQPLPQQTEVLPADVTVHYVDENGYPLLPDQTMTFGEGASAVYAAPIDGYTLSGPESYTVTVDQMGAYPTEVTFTYTRIAVSATVTVHFIDENGYRLLDDQFYTYDAGQHTVTAPVLDGYVLTGSEQQNVTVDEYGAAPEEITFTYMRYIAPASVTVHYVDENGTPLLPDDVTTLEGGSHTLQARFIDGYTVEGSGDAYVTVGADGADPAEITFRYTREVLPVNIVIHYVDEEGAQIAADTAQTLQPGYNLVYPAAGISAELYLPVSPESQEVYVTADGASPAEVTFIYRRAVQPVNVTIHYVDERGEPIAPDEVRTYGEGEHAITPSAAVSGEDYQQPQPDSYYLTVTLAGASESEFTFTYTRAVKPAMVTVHYTDAQGTPVAEDSQMWFEGGSFAVFPQPAELPFRYFLAEGSPEFQTVTVDADGAHPGEITFIYAYKSAEPVTLPIYYRDAENGTDVALGGTVTLQPDTTTAVTAAPENLLPDYFPLGDSAVYVTVNADGEADRSEIVFLYQYVAPTPEPTPEPTAEPTAEPTLEPTAEPTAEPTLEPTAEPTAVPEPTDEPEPTPEPGPVMVTVRYADQDGADVASPTVVWCGLGDTEITAAPTDLPGGYVPDGPQTALVHVDEYGADPAEIVFAYRLTAEPAVPKVALVTVKYISPKEEVFYSYSATCVEGQENKVELDWEQVDSSLGYELASDAVVYVTVDETGAAYPDEVLFRFRNEINAFVTIRYQDAATGRNVASPQQQICYVGSNTVDIRPLDLEENYVLVPGASPATVILDAEGNLTPNEVVFLYASVATATPAPQIPSYDTPVDAYFYPNGGAVRVRSTPTTTENNILTEVGSGTLGHALGKLTNRDGKVWYVVEINGVVGYMSEGVMRILSEAETAALFNYTLAPTQAPTPVPTEIPDGAVIDRWGTTIDSINFRKKPNRSADKISTVKKNTRVWIYSVQTVGDEQWYAVRCNGVDGYMMAKFVQLASEADSAAIQAQLASPMPTQTPNAASVPTEAPTPVPTLEPTAAPTLEPTSAPTSEPTSAPTSEPTAEPTLPPTEAPTSEPTPEPTAVPTEMPSYRGYAVTKSQTALRTGVSQKDDDILEMLPRDSLILVNSETYVDNVIWDSVQALSSGNWGFIPQSALQFINAEEARDYLDRLQPTPAPTDLPMEQTEGLAMTLGNGVPMRQFANTNGEIMALLPYMAVAYVDQQIYAGGIAWHVVYYDGMWGYIRQDQLRMMSQEEVQSYQESLTAGTPTPTAEPAPTPVPVTENSLSSYGHVKSTSGRVNLRSEPTTKKSNAIRLLDNYAFALVMGTVVNDEGTWYHISQGGVEGYIRGDYFHVLTLGELSDFLQSSEYLNASSNNTTSCASTSQIQPVEDYNKTVWQNPALTASYEPFTIATPTPNPERLSTETPTPAPTPSPTPTPEIAPVAPDGNNVLPENNVQQGGSPLPWVLVGLGVAGAGGAYYAYVRRQNEKRRQALLAQQARASRSAAIRPQMRTAQNNPTQNPARPAYPNPNAPFMPPQSGVPQSAQSAAQNTGVYRPVSASQQQAGAVKGDTNPFTPVRQATQAYQPLRREGGSYPQATQTFSRTAVQPSAENRAIRESKPVTQDSDAFRPAPVDPSSQHLNLNIKTAQIGLESSTAPNAETAAEAPRKRIRRTERNKDLYDSNNRNA